MTGRTPAIATLALAISLLPLNAAAPRPESSAAGGTPRTIAVQAEKLSPDWKRVRTANFEAVGNAPVEDIRRLLEKVEVFRSNLVTGFLGLRVAGPIPTLIVVLRDQIAFDRFKPRDADGRKKNYAAYFMQTGDTNLIVLSRMAGDAQSLSAVFHEYYHYVAHRNVPNIPTWLDEGLAEFYSTSELDPSTGRSIVGKVPSEHLRILRTDVKIPLDQLLSREGSAKIMRVGEPRRMAMFYAESWALVHYLMLRGDGAGEGQIKAYLDAIGRGVPFDRAFQSAFGLTYDEASRRLSEYASRSEFPAVEITEEAARGLTASETTSLTEAEAEFVQGDLLLRLGAVDEAERALQKSLALAPGASATKIALAVVRTTQGHPLDAIEALRPIVEAEARNFRAHLALASAYGKAERYEDALREYSRAAAVNDQTAAPWFGCTIAALALGRYEESDRALDRLQSVDPNPAWYQSRAYEAFAFGEFATAARDARTFLAKAGRGAESAPYMAFLGAICEWRLDRPTEATAFLSDVRPELAAGSWPSKVMDFLQGVMTATRFLASPKDVDQRTEAHAYMAFRLLQTWQRDDALANLRWVKEHGTRSFVEYGMAVAELKRLEKTAAASR